MDPIRLRCATCSKVLQVAQDHAGRVVACPGCQQELRVPEPVVTAVEVVDDESALDGEVIEAAPATAVESEAIAEPVLVESADADETDGDPEQLAAGEYAAAVLFFFVGPLIAFIWAVQRNPKWKQMLVLSLGTGLIVGSLGWWQSDRILEMTGFAKGDEDREESDKAASGTEVPDRVVSLEEHQREHYVDPDLVENDDDEPESAQPAPGTPPVIMSRRPGDMAGAPDEADLVQQPEPIQRAMRANVRLDVGGSMGSGIIFEMRGEVATIVTNRHVVDPVFAQSKGRVGTKLESMPITLVTYVNMEREPGRVVWVGNDNVDLAIVRAICPTTAIREADWREPPVITQGEDVFAVGNPVGFGWSITKGSVSALRSRTYGNQKVPIVQTDAAINRGNSGGGLYNQSGQLIGINDFIINPELAQNTGFAIRSSLFQELQPPPLNRKSPAE